MQWGGGGKGGPEPSWSSHLVRTVSVRLSEKPVSKAKQKNQDGCFRAITEVSLRPPHAHAHMRIQAKLKNRHRGLGSSRVELDMCGKHAYWDTKTPWETFLSLFEITTVQVRRSRSFSLATHFPDLDMDTAPKTVQSMLSLVSSPTSTLKEDTWGFHYNLTERASQKLGDRMLL